MVGSVAVDGDNIFYSDYKCVRSFSAEDKVVHTVTGKGKSVLFTNP